jgi:hypothetical protein
MKTLIDIETNASICIYDDATEVVIQADQIIIGNPVQTYILDRYQSNTTLIENVTSPSDWYGWKYKYVNNEWIENTP